MALQIDNQHLIVMQDELDTCNLIVNDFLGTVNKNGDEYRIQDNYFNRMLLEMLFNTRSVVSLDLSTTGLFKYQQRDVHKAFELISHCNFNPMGYGKTVETIEWLKQLKAKRILIVAPKSILWQWSDQFIKWYPEATESNLTIINYEKLLQDRTMNTLRRAYWDVIVFDEAHYLKNRESKRTQVARMLPSKQKVLLTGTLVMKNFADLWSMLNVMDWRFSGQHYWPWVNKFCEIKDDFFGRKIVGPTRNKRDLDHLLQYIDMISIRNPDLHLTAGKRISHVPIEMSAKQKKLYKDAKKILLEELPEQLTIANGAVKTLRLRQITSSPKAMKFLEDWGTKFQWIKDFVESTDEQVLVLTQFSSTATALSTFIGTQTVAVHHGQMSTEARQDALNQFKNKTKQVLVGTMQSLGTGTDGLQSCCRLGIVIDASWNPTDNEQAEDRLNRIGQAGGIVNWYYLECIGTIDKYVTRVHEIKNHSIKELLIND